MKRLHLLILLLSFFIVFPAYALSDTIYTVRKGDSLYKISRKFGVTINEIKTKNKIISSRLKPGTKLCIPTKDKSQDITRHASQVTRKAPKTNTIDKAQINTEENGTCSYTVKSGDTLSAISKKYSISIREIREINNLKSPKIKPEQKLLLCKVESDEQPKKYDAIISEAQIEKEKAKIKTDYYTVKKGDTLSSISKKYSISVSEIKEINNLRSTKIKPGQKLLVKRIGLKTYTVRKGDNIYRIAKKFNVDIDELKDINGLETDLLKPGQKLLLEPEEELDEITNYEAMLSEAQIEEEGREISKSEELSEMKIGDRIVLFAKKLLNIPYRFGGNSLLGIDCSGFVQKVYGMIGINLPRSAREQFHEGNSVDKGELSIGDLVFFRTYAPFPSHVGIYLGDDLFIHASSIKKKVTIDSLTAPYYFKRFIGAKRVIGEELIDGG